MDVVLSPSSAAPRALVLGLQEDRMMNNLNSVLIEGNLVRDPELKYTPKGAAVCSFVLASNRFFKQDEETQKEVSFFDVTTWSRLAEVCGEYLKKGRGVRVVGRLKQDRWTSPEGQTRSKVMIVAEHVEFKPNLRKGDGDGKDDESGVAAGAKSADDGTAANDAELKEASGF
jgi:single-strand DNA-binding protein